MRESSFAFGYELPFAVIDQSSSMALPAQEEGLQSFIAYLRDLILTRAEEDYTALVEGECASAVLLRLSAWVPAACIAALCSGAVRCAARQAATRATMWARSPAYSRTSQ